MRFLLACLIFKTEKKITNRTEPLDKSAYGGEGWSPRATSLLDELGSVWQACGISNEWAPLKQVLLHKPGPELTNLAGPNAVQMQLPCDAIVPGVLGIKYTTLDVGEIRKAAGAIGCLTGILQRE